MRICLVFLTLLAAPVSIWSQAPPPGRDVNWKTLVPNILDDQKQIWTFPARLVRGSAFAPTAVFAAVSTPVVLLADPPEAHYFRNTNAFHVYNTIFASNGTAIATALVPATFYVAGVIRKDDRARKTALLSAEALADTEIVATILKQASDRARPESIPKTSGFDDSWSEGGPRLVRNSGSFPSGHTITAFALATVISRRYRDHRWMPFVAYGAAAAVGFSRLTLSAHFASDVLAGGVLGFAIARFSVLRE